MHYANDSTPIMQITKYTHGYFVIVFSILLPAFFSIVKKVTKVQKTLTIEWLFVCYEQKNEENTEEKKIIFMDK